MKTLFAILITVFLNFPVLLPLAAQDGPAPKPVPDEEKKKKEESAPTSAMMLEAQKYFPMQRGNWWEYKNSPGTHDSEIPVPVDKMRKQGQRITITELTKNGCKLKSAGSEYGVEMPRSMVVKDGFVVQEAVGLDGDVKVLKLPPKKGDKWICIIGTLRIEFSVEDIETVKTPAGNFHNAVRVVSVYKRPGSTPGSMNISTTLRAWYAPGVGLVKVSIKGVSQSLTKWLIRYRVTGVGEAMIVNSAKACRFIVVVTAGKPSGKKDGTGAVGGKTGAEVGRQRLAIEKVLKGGLNEKEIMVSAAGYISEGKWLLFLGDLQKEGYSLVGPVLPAEEKILKKVDAIINPPKLETLDEKLAEADFVILGKALVKEEREVLAYWVFKIEKALKGDTSRAHLDVLITEGLPFLKGKRYILLLKSGQHHGRKLYKVVGSEAHEFSEKKLQEYEKALKK